MQRRLIEQVRSFNRTVTQRVGALQDSYLARGRPLGEARLIYEAGLVEPADLRGLRERLGLDSGYLSRLVRSLEGQELVELRRSAGDGRMRELWLTAKGRAEFAAYDSLSDGLAETILAPLGAADRERLATAMREVEKLLSRSSVIVTLEPAGSDDARACIASYIAELAGRFDGGFDPANGNSLSEAEMTPPAGYFVLARLDGAAVGCGALKRLSEEIGEIKRVWTAPEARGRGVASRIMDTLEDLAVELGFGTLRLDTNRTLAEAHALYRKRGYYEIARYNDNPYAHHWFEKRLEPAAQPASADGSAVPGR